LKIPELGLFKMNFLSDILAFFRGQKPQAKPWWIEVTTAQPACTYYFGPYAKKAEAVSSQGGFVEDLLAENAAGIHVNIEPMQPEHLTIVYDDASAA
jgi:hypothetical protein